MILHLVTTEIFGFNAIPSSKLVTEMSDIKGPGQLFIGTFVDYKNVFCLQTGKYVQVHQEDELRNTIDKY